MDHASTQSAFAAALLAQGPALPPGITSCHTGATASRFAVYRNNVRSGLVRALESIFPVTRRLVGDAFFSMSALEFAAAERPGSPLLFAYGQGFPDFLARFGPATHLAYLPEVARIELAHLAAYHARDAAPLEASVLATLPPERLGGARLVPHPAARLVRCDFAAGSIWEAHRGEMVDALDINRRETVLVLRPGHEVDQRILAPGEARFATSLFAGDTLADAAVCASAQQDFDFGTALVGLLSAGAFETLLEDQA